MQSSEGMVGGFRCSFRPGGFAEENGIAARVLSADTFMRMSRATSAEIRIDFDPPEGRRIKRWAKPVSEKIDEALK